MKKKLIDVILGVLVVAMLTGCQMPGGMTKDKDMDRDEVTEEEEGRPQKDKNRGKNGIGIADAEEDENLAEEDEKSVLDSAEIFEDGEDEEDVGEGEHIVVGGFQILVPGEYGSFIDDTKGLIIYRDDLFTMQFVVKDGSYDEKMKNPERLMEGARDIGGDIQKEIREVEVDGKPYAYFNYTYNEEDFIVIYTNALDSDERFCAQVLLVSDQLEEKEVLKRFAQIVSSAKETDKPDTTQESLNEQRTIADLGEQKKESRLECGDMALTYLVEKGFYSDYLDESTYFSSEYFLEYPHDRSVDCYLTESEGESAKEYIDREVDWLDEGALTEKDKVKVNGHTFYYLIAEYDYEGSHFRRIMAAADVGEGYIYRVSVSSIDSDKELKLTDFEKFLTFEEE